MESETYRRALERAVEETVRELALPWHVDLDEDVRELPLQQTGTNHR